MTKIDKIYVACCRKDFWLTKICVASIRYWYPLIPIYLITDYSLGDFDTRCMQKRWNVSIMQTSIKKYGSGLIKYEVLFLNNNEKVLVLDSDVVFAGKVIEKLESFDEDFIVTGDIGEETEKNLEWVKRVYLDTDKILEINPKYIFPEFYFNSGQIVVTCGKIKLEDVVDYIKWSELPSKKYPDTFGGHDQGVLNYVLNNKVREGKVSSKYYEYMINANSGMSKKISLDQIKKREGYPLIIHWIGRKGRILSKLRRSDILCFYQKFYYSKFKFGLLRRYLDESKRYLKYYVYEKIKKLFYFFYKRIV